MSAMSEPDANTTASEGGADAPTGIHEPAAAPDIAMAYSEALELAEPRRWRLPAVAFAVATAPCRRRHWMVSAASERARRRARSRVPRAEYIDHRGARRPGPIRFGGDLTAYPKRWLRHRWHSGACRQDCRRRMRRASGPDDVCLVIARMHHGCAAIALGMQGPGLAVLGSMN